MSFFMLDTDGTSVREAYNIYVKPSDEVKRVRKIYAYDSETNEVRLVFNSHTEFLLAGEATPLAAGAKEIVEFGVDSDFNAGKTEATADYIDYKVSGAPTAAFNTPTNGLIRFWPDNTGTDRVLIDFLDTSVNIADSEDFIDYFISAYDSDTASDKPGTLSKIGTDTIRLTITTQFTLENGVSELGWSSWDGGGLSGLTVTITSSAFSDTFTANGNDSTLYATDINFSDNENKALYPANSIPASFSISNTSHSIPAITGGFTSEANATTARDDLKTALENDVEFTELFEHDTDTKFIFSDSEAAEIFYITMDFSETAINTVNTSTTGGWRFHPSTVGGFFSAGSVYIPNKATSETITNATELVNYLVETYNNASSSTGHWGVATGDAGIMTITLQPNERVNDLYSVGVSSLENDIFQNNFDATMGINGTTFGNVNIGSDDSKQESNLGSFRNQTFNALTKLVTRWSSKTDSDIEDFTYSITQNTGENTTPYLEVSQEGTNPTLGTVVNITNPNEAINVSVSMTDNVGNEIANSNADLTYDEDTNILKGNPDTTINITNPNTLTITEQ